MSLGLRENRSRRRRRFWGRVIKVVVVLAGIGALGFYAYLTGAKLAEHDVTVLREEIATLSAANEALKAENDSLGARLATATRQAAQWQARFEREVPSGEIKRLTDMVVEKARAGVPLDRLEFLIDAAGTVNTCANEPETKRFIVPTPLYDGPNSSVGFANSAITVTADGQSARNENGQPEGWYDPAAPVTLRFSKLGGDTSEVRGELPLYHSVLVGDSEYRFTAVPGDRGFINITADRCKFPS